MIFRKVNVVGSAGNKANSLSPLSESHPSTHFQLSRPSNKESTLDFGASGNIIDHYNREADYGNFAFVDAPEEVLDFTQHAVSFFNQYRKAAYFFYNASILSSVITRIVNETLRNGIELAPAFVSKCPQCGTTYNAKVKECTSCGYAKEMLRPQGWQKNLLVNWCGEPLMERVNKNGQSLHDLIEEFLYNALIYGSPLILCKSMYTHNERGEVIDEAPQEFITISPMRATKVFDRRGEPGQDFGFTLHDRTTQYRIKKPDETPYPYMPGFTDEGQMIYPTHWIISGVEGPSTTKGEQYHSSEIYHKPWGLPSRFYGTPRCLQVEIALRSWIALELRVLKYYNTGHPMGVFVINNVSSDRIDEMLKSVKMRMQGDPFSVPVLSMPPANQGGGAKWIPFADNPTESMMAVKSELLQRVSAAFGINGLFLGDVHAMKGNSNEQQQASVMDRNLMPIRAYVDFALKWIVKKFAGVTDWIYRLREIPDDTQLKEQELMAMKAEVALKWKELGFGVVSIDDQGNIDVTPKPQSAGNMGHSLLGMIGEDTQPFKIDNNDIASNNAFVGADGGSSNV